MARISRLAMIVGITGAAASYAGLLDTLPMFTWIGVAAVGAVLTVIFRRPSD